MVASSHSLGEAVRIADAVTDESIEEQVLSSIRDSLDEAAKARILGLYEAGEISEQAARRLLGERDFEESQQLADDTERLLTGETSRFVAGDGKQEQ